MIRSEKCLNVSARSCKESEKVKKLVSSLKNP